MGKILNKVNHPKDIKKLNIKDLKILAKEIREFLLTNISKSGGHLASNLGVTELTIALHYVFDSPKDKLIWDVGHQCYVHKILTGRKEGFKTLRKTDGLSGFPKRKESVHDAFDAGHASTSISAGLGIARARDLKGEDFKVISVIGDGSMTGGMAFEALNDTAHSNTNLIVILNDNQMSIDKNVGGLAKYLNAIRTEPRYIEIKGDVNKILRSIPRVGDGLSHFIEKAKDSIKQFMVPGMFFEEIGFTYVGPVDGHNLDELLSVLKRVKQLPGPILVHVYSTKGRGYKIAENNPTTYHGVASFNVETGESTVKKEDDFSSVFGNKLVQLAKKDKKIVAVTAAMPSGTGLIPFMLKYPERCFDVGIAEQHAVTMSAGLAAQGLKPVIAIYSTFLQRAYDQILHDVCIQNLPVIFGVDRAGIVGADGETHQGVFDIAYLSHIPNMNIMAPRDAQELEQMIEFTLHLQRPAAIRYPRGTAYTLDKISRTPLEYGKAEIVEEGESVAVFGVGSMFKTALEVSKILKEYGCSVTLVNPRFIKPLDEETIKYVSSKNKILVTIEDHAKIGGYGSLVSQYLHDQKIKDVDLVRFGWNDEFIPHGSPNDFYKQFGLTAKQIAEKILQTLEGQ